MTTQTIEATAERQVRAVIDSWLQALHAGDLDRIMSHYAPDVLAFDAIAKLQFKGREAYREHWAACLEMCSDAMTFEAHDLQIVADRDVAFGSYLCFCSGPNEKGEEQSGWMRATVCLRRTGERWLIAHEHYSAPFDPQSGKALLDVEP